MKQGRELFARPCIFVRGASDMAHLPNTRFSEVAFAGRSNVGKSSLLNALCGRKDLARTSKTPGRTQELNLFNLGDRLMLCDLPGYGFAKVPPEARKLWNEFLPLYLSQRRQLRRVFVLIDGRHGPKDNDADMLKWLNDSGVSFQIILTKADQVKPTARPAIDQMVRDLQPIYPGLWQDWIWASAKTKEGLDGLKATIAALL